MISQGACSLDCNLTTQVVKHVIDLIIAFKMSKYTHWLFERW